MAYYLFVNNATFSWHTTLSHIIALSTTEAELMALTSCCSEIVWAHKLALEPDFPQLKPTNVYADNTGCIALANNMLFRSRSKHIAVWVCFIQIVNQDDLINVKQCTTAAQIADMRTKELPRTPFENFTDQPLSDRHVATVEMIHHSALPKPRVSPYKFDLVCSCKLLSVFRFLFCCASTLWLTVGCLTSEQGGDCTLL